MEKELAKAKARLVAARDAYIESLQGAQSPEHISNPATRERAILAKEEYEQATKALVGLTLEAGREKRSTVKTRTRSQIEGEGTSRFRP